MRVDIELAIKGLINLIDDLDDFEEQKICIDKAIKLLQEKKTLLALLDNGL